MLAEALLALTLHADAPSAVTVERHLVAPAISQGTQSNRRWWWSWRGGRNANPAGSPLPEPATMSLLALAGIGAAAAGRSRKQNRGNVTSA